MHTSVLMQKVAQVAPSKYVYLLKTAGELRGSPFVGETVAEMDGILKKANQMMGGAPSAGMGARFGNAMAVFRWFMFAE